MTETSEDALSYYEDEDDEDEDEDDNVMDVDCLDAILNDKSDDENDDFSNWSNAFQ